MYFAYSMPRKFQLSVPVKNAPRKARGRSVTVDHILLPVESIQLSNPSFSVSLPINILWDARATSLAILQKRLKELSVLPCGM